MKEKQWQTVFRVTEPFHLSFSSPQDFEFGQHIYWIENYSGTGEDPRAKSAISAVCVGCWETMGRKERDEWRNHSTGRCICIGRRIAKRYNHE